MASITITTTAAQATRINKAVGKRLSLMTNDDPPIPRVATAAEIKQFLIKILKETVRMVENRDAEQAARDAVPDINPT